MSKKFVYISEITPELIYDENYEIPKGWEVVDFRPPNPGDMYLGGFLYKPHYRAAKYSDFETWSSPQTPRLILKKSQQTVSPEVNTCIKVSDVYGPETITLPEGWKFERFGMPKHEDMVLSRYYKELSRDEPVYKHFNTDVYPKDILPRIIVKKDQ